MKILKIENGKGYFLAPNKSDWMQIDQIDKTSILSLVDAVLAENATIDAYEEETLANQAHQIIYKSISEKLNSLSENKSKFVDESQRLYLEEIKKYSAT